MPMLSQTLASPSTGKSSSRDFKSWFSQTERHNKVSLVPRPVMTAPPTQTLTKAAGAARVTIVDGGTGYKAGETISVSGGTASTAARLRVITADVDGKITSIAVSTTGVYTAGATPANPVSVSGGSGTGATFTMTWNGSMASTIINGTTWNRTGAHFVYTGSDIRDSTPGYRGQGTGNGTQCVIDFCSDAPSMDFRFVGCLSYYDLYVDGSRVAATSVTTDSSGQPYIYTVDWGGVAVPRRYTLKGINTGFGGVITGTAYTIWAPDMSRPFVWQLGDSYTYGTMATQGSFNDFGILCDILGFDGLADGIGGSGWTSSAPTTIPQNRIDQKYKTLSRTPQYVFLSLGYNDAAAGRIDQLKTNFRLSLQGILEATPDVKIVVIGPATPVGRLGTITAIRTAMMELCAEFNLPFLDLDNWVNVNNKGLYTASDQVHPTDAGYAFRAARMALALQSIL